MIRYRVSRDLQHGEFGMYRDLTITEWKMQALEWCYVDDNYELAEFIYKKLPDNETIDFIGELWALEFRKVRKDKQKIEDPFKDDNIDIYYKERFE